MSREQLLDAYLRGEISRRRFVHGLLAAGVSLGAATAYSGLAPQRARAASGTYDLQDESEPPPPTKSPSPPKPDTRPPGRHAAPELTLQASRRRRRVRVTVSSDEPVTVDVAVTSGAKSVARKALTLKAAGARSATIKLPKGTPAKLRVAATATDGAGQTSRAHASLG